MLPQFWSWRSQATSYLTFFLLLALAPTAFGIQNTVIYANNSNIEYFGHGWAHSLGAVCGEEVQAWSASGSTNDTMSLHFTGATSLTLFGSVSVNSARVFFQLDNHISDVDFSTMADQASANQCFPIFSVSGIDDSVVHTLTALHAGPGANANSGVGLFSITQMAFTRSGGPNIILGEQAFASIATTKSPIAAVPTQTANRATHQKPAGGLIVGIIFAVVFCVLLIAGVLLCARKKHWLCWKGRGMDRDLDLSRGISSEKFFAEAISNSNSDKIFFNTSVHAAEDKARALQRERSLSRLNGKAYMPEMSEQEIVVPTLAKDRTPSPVIVIDDYDFDRAKLGRNNLRLKIPSNDVEPSSSYHVAAEEAGPSSSRAIPQAMKASSPNRLQVKHFLKRVTISPNGSPRSAKFSIGKESQVEDSNHSIGSDAVSGRVSPVSVSPSWRTDDARYSGVTVKMATREVIKSEQPQFSLSWKRAGALERGIGHAC